MEAKRYDRGMWFAERFGITRLRQALLQDVHGDVLEIGVGTGANLSFYDDDVHLTAVDISQQRLAGAAAKIQIRNNRNISCADAHDLPFPSDHFDIVVSTLVFCSIPNPQQALAEIKRVLRPDGQLIMLEHVRGLTPISHYLTDWLHPVWFALQGECHLNRETAAAVENAGFQINQTGQYAAGLLQTIIANPLV